MSHTTGWQSVWMTSDPEWTLRRTVPTQGDILAVDWQEKMLSLVFFYSSLSSNFAQLSKCHLSRSLPLSFSVSPSFTGLAGVQEWLSVAKPNRSSQIHNTPSALSQAQGEQLLIFQRTLHYHSGRNTPGINTEALGCHACTTFAEHSHIPTSLNKLYYQKYRSHATTEQLHWRLYTDCILFHTLKCKRNSFFSLPYL